MRRPIQLSMLSFFILCPALLAQSMTIPLWSGAVPSPQPTSSPEHDMSRNTAPGHNQQLTDISDPAMLVFPPRGTVKNTGTAVLVFPGGGYRFLNMKAAGTEPCAWVNSLGMTCFLVKYRVPVDGLYPQQKAPLEDAQQAVRLVRSRAKEWKIDPSRIGLMGFSAGANLVLLMNAHPDDPSVLGTPAAGEVPTDKGKPVDARSNFTIACWPAYVAVKPAETELDPNYQPNEFTPATFLIQAEDDRLFHNNAIVYYRALMNAKMPGELHYYAMGGHAFGMHPSHFSQARWPDIAANWLRYNRLIPGWTEAPEAGEYNPTATSTSH